MNQRGADRRAALLMSVLVIFGALAAALVACVPPAVRAMRVDPQEGLRIG